MPLKSWKLKDFNRLKSLFVHYIFNYRKKNRSGNKNEVIAEYNKKKMKTIFSFFFLKKKKLNKFQLKAFLL